MSFKLLTLNIEAGRHIDRVRSTIATYAPDVVCLQEVLESDYAMFAATGGYHVTYVPMTKTRSEQTWGVAMLTRVPLQKQMMHCYSADSAIRVFEKPHDPRRLLLVGEFELDGKLHRVITTHFTWSPDGLFIREQEEDFQRLKRALSAYSDYVLCGDFNAPRGRPMFQLFIDELGLIDHLPGDITTTLDPTFHRAGALDYVVDTIFSTRHYALAAVQVLEGISDHKGILADVRLR
jgi:endonuclease/exonuclease/phosphatase family metal-dependent hydrolase